MKMNPKKMTVLTLSLILTGLTTWEARAAESRYFVNRNVPTEVQAAHESFLNGNYNQMAGSIKRALIAFPNDAGIQRNLLDLYDKAYALKGYHAIDPDWKMPAEASFLSVHFRKRLNTGSITYRMSATIDYRMDAELEQLRVVKYPNDVIIDKKAQIGNTDLSAQDGYQSFWMSAENRRVPHAEGLYLIEIQMKGKPAVQGYFLVSRMNATESPEVTVPTLNQVFYTRTPTFQIRDFVSSEYRSYEKRKVALSVVENLDTAENSISVSRNAPLTSFSVGEAGEGIQGVTSLTPADYLFQIAHRERHKFGDLIIGRESVTTVPFSVR